MKKANVIAVLLFILVSAPLSYGQDNRLLKVLEPVDEKQRPRLAERLNLFIGYHRTQQWAKLFNLLDKNNAEDKSVEQFAKEVSRMQQFNFVPERTTVESSDGSEYRIYGCVNARANKDIVWLQGGLVAYLQAGDWYFTTYFLRYDRTTSRPLRCDDALKSGGVR